MTFPLRSPRRALLAAAALLFLLPLAGCGFHPLYGDPQLAPEMASVFVEPIEGRNGFELRDTLINLLGSDGISAGKAYRLKLTLAASNQGVALQNDATITRYNDTVSVTYILTDSKGTELTRGSQSSLSSYNVAASPYSTLAAQRDSDKRASQDVAERIRIDLGVFFRRRHR